MQIHSISVLLQIFFVIVLMFSMRYLLKEEPLTFLEKVLIFFAGLGAGNATTEVIRWTLFDKSLDLSDVRTWIVIVCAFLTGVLIVAIGAVAVGKVLKD